MQLERPRVGSQGPEDLLGCSSVGGQGARRSAAPQTTPPRSGSIPEPPCDHDACPKGLTIRDYQAPSWALRGLGLVRVPRLPWEGSLGTLDAEAATGPLPCSRNPCKAPVRHIHRVDTSKIKTIGSSWGRLIWNPYITIVYHLSQNESRPIQGRNNRKKGPHCTQRASSGPRTQRNQMMTKTSASMN